MTLRLPRFRAASSIHFLALIAAVAGTACAAPTQGGSIEVRAGVAERLEMLCRFRHGAAASADLCGDDEREAAEAPGGPAVVEAKSPAGGTAGTGRP